MPQETLKKYYTDAVKRKKKEKKYTDSKENHQLLLHIAILL